MKWEVLQAELRAVAGAQTTLQEEYKPGMSLKEAEVLALSTLKQVMEEKVRAI